jgi:beta-aspartyl-peptidase (threonine type)
MIVVAHGGAGSPNAWKDGCLKAVQAGMALLKEGGAALDAVVQSVVVLEDDGRFNAGSGSVLRLDGKTIEMDAAVMDSQGTLGAVAVISGVKNPVLVARAVSKTPHHFLAGAGACAFARKHGFPEFYPNIKQAKERYEKVREALASHAKSLKENWNFEVPFEEVFPHVHDTVGAVAWGKKGDFAVAASTGGSGGMLQGRVGDTPLIGCGFFAGPAGAVAVTGIGEEIMKRLLSKTIYDWMAEGFSPQSACEKGVALFPKEIAVGAIAVSAQGAGAFCNREMAFAILH